MPAECLDCVSCQEGVQIVMPAQALEIVMPAKAGIQDFLSQSLDASLRWHDNLNDFLA